MRLHPVQKREAVMRLMSETPYGMAANTIAKRLGFKTGRPLHETLCHMKEAGEAHAVPVQLNTKNDAYLWYLTEKGRAVAFEEFGIRS